MDLPVTNSVIRKNGIIWAITASILLHTFVAVVVPNFNFSSKKETRHVLKIELQKPAPPTPVPAPMVEPLPPIDIPEPPKPKPIKKKIKPIVKPKPIKKEALTPIEEPLPEVAPPPVVEEVIAVQPSDEITPEVVVPPAPTESPPPPEPSQADKNNALSAYGSLLGRAIAKHKSYPKMAQRRGWQGTVLLSLKIDGDGNVLSAIVRDSSGHDSLDKRALAMVKKASPFPKPPPALQGNSFNLAVPVTFKLADG
ncbi:MAG: energy transducer TonB [Methylophilaceae bacterium]